MEQIQLAGPLLAREIKSLFFLDVDRPLSWNRKVMESQFLSKLQVIQTYRDWANLDADSVVLGGLLPRRKDFSEILLESLSTANRFPRKEAFKSTHIERPFVISLIDEYTDLSTISDAHFEDILFVADIYSSTFTEFETLRQKTEWGMSPEKTQSCLDSLKRFTPRIMAFSQNSDEISQTLEYLMNAGAQDICLGFWTNYRGTYPNHVTPCSYQQCVTILREIRTVIEKSSKQLNLAITGMPACILDRELGELPNMKLSIGLRDQATQFLTNTLVPPEYPLCWAEMDSEFYLHAKLCESCQQLTCPGVLIPLFMQNPELMEELSND